MILEHLAHTVAGTLGPARNDGFSPCPRLGLDALDDGFEKIGIRRLAFGGKIGRKIAGAVDDRQGFIGRHEGGELGYLVAADEFVRGIFDVVKQLGIERFIGCACGIALLARFLAGGIVIADLRSPFAVSLANLIVEKHGRISKI